jgi:hypothetical protein
LRTSILLLILKKRRWSNPSASTKLKNNKQN